ncbi:MAG: hypothetical protein COV31_01525 [Candidatus Yanofskybacteria bacterium CG10_big_fil_rev_8_21_14_0_10_46_23]|uniref:PrgI family protein n=1 Tax=Candidatus Yanofskybacteria bacterium CG10_big_fil_rev_8_21_14_0_10_46_23 TaxID=1975098 RepID=A0A2H0R4B0_9BACT|nr:MAG: hypothetical protein COV31_01525 [Candidatus Yanofskybacteria bacterium CG10_big_fil_rev_8_21_14_0_10_46_23]
MQFQVPQFIDTEEKIVGPLTLKQFLWVAGGVSIVFIIFVGSQSFLITFLIGGPILVIAGALAFLKVGNTPLPRYAYYAFKYLTENKRFLFQPKKQVDSQTIKLYDQRE